MHSPTTLDGLVEIACAESEPAVALQLLEASRAVLGAPVAIAVLVDELGVASALVHSGISVDELARLPHLPSPVGLVSVVLGGTSLRLDEISSDSRSAGLLDALQMRRLLAAPLWIEGQVVGGVFVARRGDEPGFELAAEQQLSALCRLAAARVASLRHAAFDAAKLSERADRLDAEDPARSIQCGSSPSNGPTAVSRWKAPARHVVHVQPIVDLSDGRTAGYEALSRFPDAHDTCRSPEVVFDEATKSGHGVELEHIALQHALEVLPLLPTTSYLSVNLSPQAILAPAVFAALSGALRRHPRRLVVELTEHAQVMHYPALLKTLSGLRACGLRVAVDDIGAGFASLRHVTMLHPDMIKLDKDFVRGIDADQDRRALARAIITFAAEIGASFVAEGVETEGELRELRAIGAAFGQGYFLGRPAPPSVLEPDRVADARDRGAAQPGGEAQCLPTQPRHW